MSTKEVFLGSGDLYAIPITEVTDVFSLTTAEEAKLTSGYLGYIEANATLKAVVETIDLVAANAGDVASLPKSKKVSFQTGIFSFNLDNVSKFLTGSKYTVDEATGKSTFTYANEDKTPNVYLRFVSENKASNRRIIVNMFSCSFSGELAFEFSNEKPVVFDYSFKVLSQKSPTSGKHIYYEVTTETIV